MLERVTGRRARLDEEGLLYFEDARGTTVVLIGSGMGWMRWERLDAELDRRIEECRERGRHVTVALVSNVTGSREDVVTPDDIAKDVDPTSVAGAARTDLVTTDELRADPDLALRMVA